MWDVDSEQVVVTIPTGPADVVVLGFTPDGGRLAVATDDGVVSLHLLSLDALLEFAHDRISRELTEEECRQYLHVPSCPPE